MSSAGEQLARLLALVPWLRAHPGVDPERAAEEFGITTDQLEADLNLLIVCGIPGGQHGQLFDIEFWADDPDEAATGTDNVDADASGLVRLGPSITVHDAQSLDRPMRLGQNEAVSLQLGLNLLRTLPGGFDRDRLDALAARLEAVAGDAWAGAEGVVTLEPLAEPDTEVVSTIEAALSQGKRLDLTYLVPSRDEVTARQVDPVRLALVDGRQYLVAWCRSAQDWRHFRVDRIVSAAVSAERVEAHAHAVAQAPAQVSYQPDAQALSVVLEVAPSARWITEYAVVDRLEAPSATGVARVELSTASLDWVAQLVLRAGGGAVVIHPPELAAIVARRAQTTAQAQRSGQPVQASAAADSA